MSLNEDAGKVLDGLNKLMETYPINTENASGYLELVKGFRITCDALEKIAKDVIDKKTERIASETSEKLET